MPHVSPCYSCAARTRRQNSRRSVSFVWSESERQITTRETQSTDDSVAAAAAANDDDHTVCVSVKLYRQ